MMKLFRPNGESICLLNIRCCLLAGLGLNCIGIIKMAKSTFHNT